MMELPYIVQVRAGKLKTYTYKSEKNETFHTFKSPLIKEEIRGKVWINHEGIFGDDGIDDKPKTYDKALFAYTKEHNISSEQVFQVGQMGENLVVSNCDEYNVFIGDTYKVGEAIVQVSQPRIPCWRLSYHMDDIHFAKKVKESGRTGWHFRVLKEGFIHGDINMTLIERPYPQWSIARCNELLYAEKYDDLNELYNILDCHLLSKNWLTLFNERLKGRNINYNKRLYGPLNI